MKKYKVGILGGTGMVGQRFISLLENHPWFEVVLVAASPKSKGKKYSVAVKNRWKMKTPIPESVKNLIVLSVTDDKQKIIKLVDFVFSALDLEKKKIKEIEIAYAKSGIPVVSNNSAHRWTSDIPMIMPEINPEHIKLIDVQRKNREWDTGLIAVKPNCSIQSYVSVLTALKKFEPTKVIVTSLQAISGAGKNFESWPEMIDNVIPFIGGEEEKSEQEPMKIWGSVQKNKIINAKTPKISATCIRVPVADGHMASVVVKFKTTPTRKQFLDALAKFSNPLKSLGLPSAPKHLIKYFATDDRPQTRSERDYSSGMGITVGRLKESKIKTFDWEFISLSHNTIRGAAGGSILVAELLSKKGYITHRI